MAKRKRSQAHLSKPIFIVIVIIALIGVVSAGIMFNNFIADRNLQKAISENPVESDHFNYSGTQIKDTGTSKIVTYSKLGTGFEYEFQTYSIDFNVDTSNPEHMPNLVYENVMPFTDSYVTFSYVNPDDEVPGGYFSDLKTVSNLTILSRKNITVDGHTAQIIEAEENIAGYGEENKGFYSYHIFVVVEDVMQAKRYSSSRVEKLPKKFVIHGSTGNTTDERASTEIRKQVNEIIPTLKFTEN